ncbi:MAG: hypothetical protein HYT16_02290 [DPANN group archaeon]|nr:hypothetical protein [DPANN group archaeon]
MVDGSEILALFSILLSFLATFFLIRAWIRIAKRFNLVGKDANKLGNILIPEIGGLPVLFGTLTGLLAYVFFKTFIIKTETHLIVLFAAIIALMLASFVGFIDDVLGWKQGLAKWQKPLLTLPAAVPLIVINAGHSAMLLPLLGVIDFGILYPLVIIPVSIVGATNGFNMLAGLNGLEAGMGAIILAALGYIALLTGTPWLAIIAFCAVVSLLAFLLFNRFPAKIFPGNTLTHGTGALIAILAVLGNMERAAVILFLPYFAELVLKARYKFEVESCSNVPQPDGTLKAPDKTASLVHIFVRLFGHEKTAARGILATEFVLAVLVILSYA